MTPTQRILPESSVIAPRDPSTDNNTDDWPVFDLHDVTVVDPNGEPASLLHASAHYPLTVRGRLRPLSKDLSYLYLRHQGQPSLGIEITDVRMFSYGAYKNGSIGLWASGKAGWFQISPSAAYRRTYDEMTEAVNLLYFVADSFTTARTSGKGNNSSELNTQGLFERYAAKKMGNKATAAEAAEKFYEHREFLLGSMMSGKEGMSWGANPFYKHLKNKFPGDWENVRRRLFDSAQTPAGTASRPRGGSVDSASTSSSLKRKRGRPAKSQAADVVSIASSVASSSAAKTAPAKSQAVSNSQPATLRTNLASRSTRSQSTSIPNVPETPELQKTSRTGAEDEDSEDTDSLPRHSKAKSALRLKPNKPIKGPRRSIRPPSPEAEDDDAIDDSDNPTTGAPAAVDSHHKSHDLDEGISMPTSPSSSASAGALQHIPDPLYEDTWRCALVGCTHRVYAASHPDSQALIKQHYALHASDDDERVKLVQALAAPSLPAGRLIERVRLQARNDLGGMEGKESSNKNENEAQSCIRSAQAPPEPSFRDSGCCRADGLTWIRSILAVFRMLRLPLTNSVAENCVAFGPASKDATPLEPSLRRDAIQPSRAPRTGADQALSGSTSCATANACVNAENNTLVASMLVSFNPWNA